MCMSRPILLHVTIHSLLAFDDWENKDFHTSLTNRTRNLFLYAYVYPLKVVHNNGSAQSDQTRHANCGGLGRSVCQSITMQDRNYRYCWCHFQKCMMYYYIYYSIFYTLYNCMCIFFPHQSIMCCCVKYVQHTWNLCSCCVGFGRDCCWFSDNVRCSSIMMCLACICICMHMNELRGSSHHSCFGRLGTTLINL